MKKYTVLLVLLIFSSLAWSAPSKRLFDYDFPVGNEASLPSSNASSINISESMVHKPNLNSSGNVLDIKDDFMGNFPELIQEISSALKEITTPETSSLKEIDIQSNNSYEASTPELKIFDKNQ